MTKTEAPWWAGIGVRYSLEAAPSGPLYIELPNEVVRVPYADLVRHAGGREVAAVACVSSSFTMVRTGGAMLPGSARLYTGERQLLGVWPGDTFELFAVKPAP